MWHEPLSSPPHLQLTSPSFPTRHSSSACCSPAVPWTASKEGIRCRNTEEILPWSPLAHVMQLWLLLPSARTSMWIKHYRPLVGASTFLRSLAAFISCFLLLRGSSSRYLFQYTYNFSVLLVLVWKDLQLAHCLWVCFSCFPKINQQVLVFGLVFQLIYDKAVRKAVSTDTTLPVWFLPGDEFLKLVMFDERIKLL